MWLVAKYKKGQLDFFKKNLTNIAGKQTLFFNPKIKKQVTFFKKVKFLEKFILGCYIICFNEEFKEATNLKKIQNLKGLDYYLFGSKFNQKEIVNFINYCKKHEDKDGFITQNFFNIQNINKGRFLQGPFTNFIFDVIEIQKNKIKVLIAGNEISLSKKSNCLFQPI